MRRAIHMLQSVHRLYGDEMNAQAVLDISGALPAERVAGIFEVCRTRDFDRFASLAQDLLAEGFPVSQIISQMLTQILTHDTGLGNLPKAKLATTLAEADKQLTDGAGDYM